jgi:prophage regulatory protein
MSVRQLDLDQPATWPTKCGQAPDPWEASTRLPDRRADGRLGVLRVRRAGPATPIPSRSLWQPSAHSSAGLSNLKDTQHRVSVIRGVVECAPAFFNDLRRQSPCRPLAARLQLEVPAGGGHDKKVTVRFLRPRQVLEMIGVSRTTLWRMVQARGFPRPVWITERNRGYLLESVEAWMKARAEGHSFDADVARAGLATGRRGAQAVVDGALRRAERRTG